MSNKDKTTATREEAKPALVPKLRFPAFLGTRWVHKNLEDVAPLQRGFDLPSDLIRPGDIPIVYSNGIQKYHEVGMATAPGLVTGRSGTIGKLHFIEHGEYWPHNTSLWVTDFKGNDPRFVYYLYGSIGMDRFSSGSGVPTLNRNDVHAFSAPIPNSAAEQQKIAECLSSVDELMAAQARKVDALKTHKKGLMQQLFPCEGETEPRLRFSDEGDWTVVGLPEVVFFQEGPGIMAVDFRTEGVPLVRLAGVSGAVVTLDGCNYLDSEKVAQKWSHFRLVVDDLIISTSATFGLSSIVTDAAAGAVFYTGLIRFRSSNKRLDSGYLNTFLGSPNFERQAESAAVGGGIKHFGPSHIKQMEIPLPPLFEQQRIASCLAALDALITAQTQKLEALKTHKKGLMRQLFPSSEAIAT